MPTSWALTGAACRLISFCSVRRAILREKGVDIENLLKEIEELAAFKGGVQAVGESEVNAFGRTGLENENCCENEP